MGEATEVALRVLAEKVGLPGYADMPTSLEQLSKHERATFCNDYWQREQQRVSSTSCSYPLLWRRPDSRMVSMSCPLLRQM